MIFKKLFGKKQEKPHTVEELSFMLAEAIGDEDDFRDEAEIKLFNELKNIDGFVEYLHYTASKDIKRYFAAVTKEERLMIRGAFARTNYLKARITGEKKRQLKSKRYG